MTSSAGTEMALAAIGERLANIERYPLMWGQPEAIEFQFLLMVELRQIILRPIALKLHHRETRDAYMIFIQSINGGPTNTYLHVILHEEGHLDELPRLLGDFGRWVAVEYPPESSR